MSSDPTMQTYQTLSAKYRVPMRVIEAMIEIIQNSTGKDNTFFDIPELGGIGMWHPTDGAHIGNGFNRDLNNRATELFNEIRRLSEKETQRDETTIVTKLDTTQGLMPASITPGAKTWWSERYGTDPTLTGNAGGLRYAYFKNHNRLIIQNNLRNRIFDTTGYDIVDVIAGKRTGFFNTIIKTSEENLPITRLREVAR